mgnify:CR=1 FL=1
MNTFMKLAHDEAVHGSGNGDGGPFGAVIIHQGTVIATAHNEVLKSNDPTAHAEMLAIRKAASVLNRFDLSDCELYTSCEPCPMCLSAIYWARIKTVYYGCTRYDAADIGFDDNAIYEYLKQPALYTDTLKLISLNRDECLAGFQLWRDKADKIIY